MNVLFVSESIWMSGAVYDLHIMAEGLSMLGHKVYAVDSGEVSEKQDTSDLDCKFQKVWRVYSDACVYLKSPRFKESFSNKTSSKTKWQEFIYRYHEIYSEIEKVLETDKIDVIVLYSAARCGIQTVSLANKYNIPVVFRNIDMLHKLWPNFLEREAVRIIEKYIYPRMNMFFALTPKYAEYLIKLGAKRSRVNLLPFPINLEDFHPAVECSEVRNKWNLKEDDLVIVFIGTLYEFGGLVDFVHEFPKVLAQVPRAKLLIVGDGAIRARLEEIIDELNINDSAIITGHQPFSHMPQYINAATICFNAFPINSYTKDIFSAKIVQYLACGKVVVSSALPGVTTVIPADDCGVVYVNDALAMTNEIIALLKSPERIKRMSLVGLDFVKRFHSHKEVILKLEEMLERCISEEYKVKAKGGIKNYLLKNIWWEFLPLVMKSMARVKFFGKLTATRAGLFNNILYNSASNGYCISRAGQRIDGICAGTIIKKVALYMDKVGDPAGIGRCVVRRVSDDLIIGTLGALDISKLPDAKAPRPKWVVFNTNSIKIPKKGDYRILFEWDPPAGEKSNYPRLRYNTADSIGGIYTEYRIDGKWIERPGADTSIKLTLVGKIKSKEKKQVKFNDNYVEVYDGKQEIDPSRPLVSILTPVLNANKYLEQCIQSVLHQTYYNIEHIFADGGSTDGTLETLAKYNAKYPNRVRFISQVDKGVGSALKEAYKKSKGEIIGWIDSDDIYEIDAIETAVSFFNKNTDTRFIYGGCNLIDANSKVIGGFVIRDFDKKEWLNVWHYIVFCATFFKREVVEKVGFVNDLGNDLYFYLKVAEKFKMHKIEKTLTNWRLHEDSISLKKASRESNIRKDRAKEDFFLVLKHGGSIFSPRALTYYGVLEPSIAKKLGPFFYFLSPVLQKIGYRLKASMYVANRKGGSYAYPLIRNIFCDFLRSIKNLFSGTKMYENLLYNSASDCYFFPKAGQRINVISSEAVVNNVSLYMDKVGNPKGLGSCVVRRVKDDSVVGILGTVDVSKLPDAKAQHPQWVFFNANSIKIPQKGDYRIVFEWDVTQGNASNYPRVRYNDTNSISGVFTQYSAEGKWKDRADADTSIKIGIN